MAQTLLIINANASHAAELKNHIRRNMRLETLQAASGEEALHAMINGHITQPDIVLFAVGKNPISLEIIRAMRNFRTDLQVVGLFDYTQAVLAMDALTYGATDFLLMPFHAAQLKAAIRNALIRRELQIEARHSGLGAHMTLGEIQAQSAALSTAVFLASKLAQGNAPVVLEGATGTGREMLARAIHTHSARKQYPFMVVNASLLLPVETNSILFGDEKKAGMLSMVGNGSLLIRNVDALPEAVLQKLLRSVKEDAGLCTARPEEKFCGRLLFTVTNADNPTVKKQNLEMANFFSLLNALPVSLPNLHDIPEDIPLLAHLYCRHYAACEGKAIFGISAAANQMLREMQWPGNMEQLSQNVFSAVMCCQGHELQVKDFRYLFHPQSAEVALAEKKSISMNNTLHYPQGGATKYTDDSGHIKRLQDIEEEMIRYALKRYNGHISDVARHLGIGRSTLYRKIATMEEETTIPARTRRLAR